MNPDILSYLESQKVGVLSALMPDGSVHGATIHYAYSENPLVLYCVTDKKTLKVKSVEGGRLAKASFVIGTDEATMKTFQADGTLELVDEISSEREAWEGVYVARFPKRAEWLKGPDAARLKFIATWWRYTDMKHPDGKLIIASDK